MGQCIRQIVALHGIEQLQGLLFAQIQASKPAQQLILPGRPFNLLPTDRAGFADDFRLFIG